MMKTRDVSEMTARLRSVQEHMNTHPFTDVARGFVRYVPDDCRQDTIFACFSGRACDPHDTTQGIHMSAAWASMLGFRSFVASAHGSSRVMAMKCLDEWFDENLVKKIIVSGHSHGADHASVFCAELKKSHGIIVTLLQTVDPVNSPWPFPLKKIADESSVVRHHNYFQRNRLWHGGSMVKAEQNNNVSDPILWPSWSQIIRNGAEEGKAKRTHRTIDEDLFLEGCLTSVID